MILERTPLVDTQDATAVLSARRPSVCLLQMEAQDTLLDIVEVLCRQQKPVFLLLPANGELFASPAHFVSLRRMLAEREWHFFLCLIVPSERTNVAALATHAALPCVSSLEEAFQTLVQAPQVTQQDALQVTEPFRQETIAGRSKRFSVFQPSGKRPVLLGMLLVAGLIVASALLLPFMLFSPIPSKPGTMTQPPGEVAFLSSGQYDPNTTRGYNDIITMSLRSIPAPPTGMVYSVWLMPDPGDDTIPPLRIGTLHTAGPVRLTYTSPEHTNLLASYSGIRVMVQPSKNMPDTPDQNPADWRWQGSIPDMPTPGDEHQYSLLSHVRHLLAKDPTLQANHMAGGLAIWLTRNVTKVEEWASAAQGDWHGTQTSNGDAAQIHNHMLRILEYLDGEFYYTRDVPTGSPWLVDPQAGKIGLLNSVPNQNPPVYLAHVDIHLTGLAGAPGHTSQEQHLAVLIDTVIQRMRTDLLQVRLDAAKLVSMKTQQLQQQANEAILDEMATLTTEVKSGWFDSSTGENIGGVLWMNTRLQQLASFPLSISTQHS